MHWSIEATFKAFLSRRMLERKVHLKKTLTDCRVHHSSQACTLTAYGNISVYTIWDFMYSHCKAQLWDKTYLLYFNRVGNHAQVMFKQ